MSLSEKDVLQLVDRFLEDKGSKSERDSVARAYNRLSERRKVVERDLDVEKIYHESWNHIALATFKTKNKANLIRLRWIYSAAATIILGFGLWFYWSQSIHNAGQRIAHDVAPGKRGATLTLSDGRSIVLDASGTGEIAAEGGVRIVKSSSGQLIYEIIANGKQGSDPSARNVLATLRGQTFQVRLPDGSAVWLNAASSLKYPSTFAHASQRVVDLDGEAYFEVAHDTRKPFVVRSRNQQVEVLGTHFNVKSYEDESEVRTTLLEGKVRVSAGSDSRSVTVLRPGQQAAQINTGIAVRDVNTDEVVAWRNDYFRFVDTPLKEIMNQISRWYDVEVEYKGDISDLKLNASISRNRNLSQILKMIEKTNEVHFNIERRRIIVSK